MRRVAAFVLAAGLLLSSYGPTAADDPKAALGAWGVETKYVDDAIKPGNDFYRHVNNGWLTTAHIPDGFSSANAFVDATLNTEKQLDELIAGIVGSDPAPGTDAALIKALYSSHLDVAKLNALGLKPVKQELDDILAASSVEDVARWMARPFIRSLIYAGVELDAGRPDRYIVGAYQSGLGLPTREYYLFEEEPYIGHRLAYRDYMVETFRRAGIDNARQRSSDVLRLETAIAGAQWSNAEQRDPVRMYHRMSMKELADYAPGFPWTPFLEEAGFGNQTEIVINTDTAIQALSKLFAATPVETWKSYMAFHYLDDLSPFLSEEWQQASFDFNSRRLQGVDSQRPLKERSIQFVSDMLGEPLGHAYVDRYFPADHRRQMDDLVSNLRAAFKSRIEKAGWMDEPTRKEALTKLAGITSHIAYPDQWRDYSAVRMDAADLVGNLRAIEEFERADSLAALGGPRRDWQWGYSPQTVNAGYSPSMNSITFPAAILQPPFFDANADPAVNYGSGGAVIGHEMSHGFDDEGSQSDAVGALRDWWTKESRDEFEKRASVLVDQYSTYSPVKGIQLSGALTLGENLGDLGGLVVAYEAYRLFVEKEQGGKAPIIDGLTGDQRFFLSWAQLWRELSTEGRRRQLALSDPHSPGEFRTNGVVRNVDAWYEAFGVKQGDALYLPPEQRAKIW